MDIENKLKIQRDFFRTDITKDLSFRIDALTKLKEAIKSNRSVILDCLLEDLDKCHFEGFATEVNLVISEIDFMLRNLKKLIKPKKVRTPLAYFGGKSFIISEPYGQALIIGPWNYPFQLTFAPLVGAIAAGNCAVIKPSELSPKTSAITKRIISETFDERYIMVFEGDANVSKALLDYKFDYIFFTGGTAIGKVVMQAAAKNLTPMTLELGGKSPCIVDSNTNIENAARRIAWGKFINAGQTCVAPDYVLVENSIKDKLIAEIKKTIKDFYGDTPIESKHYCRIINQKHFIRITNYLKNLQVVIGGNFDCENLRIEPTVVEGLTGNEDIMQEEIFGPILPVLTYNKIEDAIAFVNDRPKPLALYIFTNNKKLSNRILKQTSSGGVCINDTISHITSANLPFGGVGESGMGNYHGKATFDVFSHKRSVLRSSMMIDAKIKYPPYKMSVDLFEKAAKWLLR